ncbi:MAG: flagellar hook-basal body complex protein [Rhodospirillaceae bacterium]|nr:flagellar hook-basal body complex protein [Rhodospirillales bacterium]
MSTDLGSISQNVANVNTTGYKRTETMFKTMMSEHKTSPNTYTSGLNIFGVQAVQRNHIDAQGVIQASSTWSDLAINGRGFFMVAPPTDAAAPLTVDTEDPDAVLYTRDGSWMRTMGPDTDANLARSYFTTGAGNYLLGWMADDTGTIDTSGTLEPVYTLAPRPIPNNGTAAVDNASTLTPSTQTMPGRESTSASILGNLPRSSSLGGTLSTVDVLDGLGATQTVSLSWQRTAADTWTVTPSNPYATAWSVPSWTVTVDDTGAVTSPVGAQPVDITWDATHGAGLVSTTINPSSAPVSRGELQKIPVQVFDSDFTEHTVTLGFERIGTNSWYMFTDPGTGGTGSAPVALTFDDNGQLTVPASGLVDIDATWTTTGPPATTSTVALNVDLTKLSQFEGSSLYLGHVNTDGYATGNLMATTFTETGELQGYYTNGHSRTLFKVPVANFVAENALAPISGNLFRRTKEAGDVLVTAIEDAPGEGRFATSSLESSTTDIEDEFTRMIMTQKAYSTNAQVFKTADEMTSTARDLKR